MTAPSSGNSSVSVEDGEWETLKYDSQIEAVHMALLHTGKVLYYSGNREYEGIATETRLWTPTTGAIKKIDTPDDMFCAGHSFLPDGRLLSTGGTLETRSPIPTWLARLARPILGGIAIIGQRIFGAKNITVMTGHTILYLFDPSAETWTRAGDMKGGRWYPTDTTLPNGQILILSGRDEAGGIGSTKEPKINMRVEIFDVTKGVKQVACIPKMDGNGEHHGFPSLYPRMHVLPLTSDNEKKKYPAGKAFCSGYGPKTKMLNLANWKWEDVGRLTGGLRHDGCSVLLPLRPTKYRAEILTCGGSNEETSENAKGKKSAEKIDFGADTPAWEAIADMRDGRIHAGSVILPDGKILIVGGNSTGMFSKPVNTVELFDPTNKEYPWRKVADTKVPRGYHTTTILLPDGRVLLSGTTPWGKPELRMEIYSPYYLFKGKRPRIKYVHPSISYDTPFTIEYSVEAGSIKSVVLIRPGAMTHAFDMDQRYIELEIIRNDVSGEMTVMSPKKDTHVAPPGYYMLFLLTDTGIPSEATFLHLPI